DALTRAVRSVWFTPSASRVDDERFAVKVALPSPVATPGAACDTSARIALLCASTTMARTVSPAPAGGDKGTLQRSPGESVTGLGVDQLAWGTDALDEPFARRSVKRSCASL